MHALCLFDLMQCVTFVALLTEHQVQRFALALSMHICAA